MNAAWPPGVRVTAAPSAEAGGLPRMDIALFVGFAASGPVHRAVAVDSPATFARVFGGEAPLAWDAVRGETLTSLLGLSVRAFFENGGRRAYVIRTCRTEELQPLLPPGGMPVSVAEAGIFPVPGMLSLPAGGAPEPAHARARSLGSWADGLHLRARLLRAGFRPTDVAAGADGLVRFRAGAALAPGDLVELWDEARPGRAYLQVKALSGGAVEASLLARFTRLADTEPADGTVSVPSLGGIGLPARLHPAAGGVPRMEISGEMPEPARAGHWLRWSDGARVFWLLPGLTGDWALEGFAAPSATAWAEGDSGPLPSGWAARVSLETLVEGPGGLSEQQAGFGLTPVAARNWWQQIDDDLFYAPGDAATVRPTLVQTRDPVPLAWLPLGLGAGWGETMGPVTAPANPLERDGLAAFGPELFTDPRLEATGLRTLVTEAERILAEPGGALLGLHGALAIPPVPGSGDLPSLLVLPDAVHPGWDLRADDAVALPPRALPEAPAHWAGHRGPCAEPAERLEAPAHQRFLDCGTRLLPNPNFLLPAAPVAPGLVELEWTASEPGAAYLLEEADSPCFAGAVEIARTEATSHVIRCERTGDYYLRLTATKDGEVSLPALGLLRVRASAYEVLGGPVDGAGLVRIHRAALRMAAAEGATFALLSLPRCADAAEASAIRRELKAERGLAAPQALAAGERHALSYGALLYGWLMSLGTPARAGTPPPLLAAPSCGAIAGVMARRTLAGGAWVSPAGQVLRGPVALARRQGDGVAARLIAEGIMPMRELPQGYVLAEAYTLAEDEAWLPIGTRRLFSLLRRLILVRASAYVFEPIGPVLSRSIERGLDEVMQTLFRAGAFAGFRPAEAYRVSATPTAEDRDAGRVIAEVAVAPSRPMAFLNVVLRQLGERLTFEETR